MMESGGEDPICLPPSMDVIAGSSIAHPHSTVALSHMHPASLPHTFAVDACR